MRLMNFTTFKKVLTDCQKAQRLTIKKEESKLTLSESIRLRIHLRYCGVCRKFQQFSALLNQVFGREKRELEERPPVTLTNEEKIALQRQVDELTEDR